MARARVDLGTLLTRTARAQRSILTTRLAELDLYAGQDELLCCLGEQDGQSQVALVGRLGVESPTVTKMVGRLESAGFVRRRSHPADRRVTQVWLTPSGRSLLPAVQRARAAAVRQVTAPLTSRQRATLEELLGRMVGALEER